jgi:hypothetical protein
LTEGLKKFSQPFYDKTSFFLVLLLYTTFILHNFFSCQR